MFRKKEIIALVISILLLSFVFGFDDGSKTFNLNYWLLNFLKVLLIVSISLLLREAIIKLIAGKKGCESEYEIWSIRRYWIYEKNKFTKGIPVAAIIAIILALISNGKIFFTAIGKNIIRANKELRVGRKFVRLTQYDESLILASGILTTAFLTVLFSFFNKMSWVDFGLIINLNFWLTVWALLPLPLLNGGRLFMNSRVIYIFVLALVLIMFILKDVNVILNLILSLVSAGVLVSIYYYFIEY